MVKVVVVDVKYRVGGSCKGILQDVYIETSFVHYKMCTDIHSGLSFIKIDKILQKAQLFSRSMEMIRHKLHAMHPLPC
jgi:hypothetical protein